MKKIIVYLDMKGDYNWMDEIGILFICVIGVLYYLKFFRRFDVLFIIRFVLEY